METPSNPKTEDYTYKQGQYSPRKRKDTTPKVNPQLAVEIVFQELKRVEAYTKRIEDATAKKVEIDRGSLESAENRLKNVLAKVSMYSILCAFFSLLFACLMCYLWVDAAKDRDNYKRYYEYFQEMDKQKSGE